MGKEMRAPFKSEDLISDLTLLVEKGVKYYKSDFEYDKEIFLKTSQGSKKKNFIWFTRESGTGCLFERDAYINETYGRAECLTFLPDKSVQPYAIYINGNYNDKISAAVYPLDREQLLKDIKENSVSAKEIVIRSEDREPIRLDYARYNANPYGYVAGSKVLTKEYLPEKDDEIKLLRHLKQLEIERGTNNMEEKNNIKIISTEGCWDKDYGEHIVQYQKGDVVSFAFSDNAERVPDIDTSMFPLWSDLSEELRNEILEIPFDMHFVEKNDDEWNKEKADKLYAEAVKHSLDGVITRGEDDSYLTIYAGAMGQINWKGHYEYGMPCLENAIVDPAKIEELNATDGISIYEYEPEFGGKYYVFPTMAQYENNDNLYIGLGYYDAKNDMLDYYGDVTVNISKLPYLHSAIDTNNNGQKLISFLEENGFGERTRHVLASGFCIFPVFKFSEEKLAELFPKEFVEYQRSYGMESSLDKRIENIKEDEGPVSNIQKEDREGR